MLERTLVYVDTSYLLASFYNSWDSGARGQLEIDLRGVVRVLDEMISQQLGQPIQRQFWYDGIPESGPHRYQRQLRSIDGVQLRAGQLIEWGDRRTQKGVDTLLVVDMVTAAFRSHASDIVLVSGDADMLPGVREAVKSGVRVHLYGFGWDSTSSALRYESDTTTILDPREDFAESMRLNVLEGPLQPTVRNKPLGDCEEPEDQEAVPVPGFARPTEATPAAQEESKGKDSETLPDAPLHTPDPDTRSSSEDSAAPAAPAAAPVPEAPPAQTAPAAPVATPQPEAHPEPMPEVPPMPGAEEFASHEEPAGLGARPNPSMMAPKRKLRSRYVPLPNEVWSSAGFHTPFDAGQQYATWWFENVASDTQRDEAHLLTGGGLPPEIDRPLLQFACESLHEYTLTETQRVNLRDGFHSGIRAILLSRKNG